MHALPAFHPPHTHPPPCTDLPPPYLQVQSLYVLLSLSTSALLVTTLLALAHLRARTHATPPSFDDLPLAYRLPLYLAALVQLAGARTPRTSDALDPK